MFMAKRSVNPILCHDARNLLEVSQIPSRQSRVLGQADTCDQQVTSTDFLELLVPQEVFKE
jgi:hypothetical protein